MVLTISARHLRRPAVFRPAVVASCTKTMEPYRTLRVVVAGESPLPARAKTWAVHLRAQYWTRPPRTAGSRLRGSSRPCRRKATCKLGMSTLSALCTARLLKMTPVQWRTDARNAKSGMDVATADTAWLLVICEHCQTTELLTCKSRWQVGCLCQVSSSS